MFFDLKKKEKRVANSATLLYKGGAEFGGDTAQLRKAVDVWGFKMMRSPFKSRLWILNPGTHARQISIQRRQGVCLNFSANL